MKNKDIRRLFSLAESTVLLSSFYFSLEKVKNLGKESSLNDLLSFPLPFVMGALALSALELLSDKIINRNLRGIKEIKISRSSFMKRAAGLLEAERKREKANFLRFFFKEKALDTLDDILAKRPWDSLSYYLKAKIFAQKGNVKEYVRNLYKMLFTFSEFPAERKMAKRVLNRNWHYEFLYIFFPTLSDFIHTHLVKRPRFTMHRTIEIIARGDWEEEKNRPLSVFHNELRPFLASYIPEPTLDFLEAMILENEYYIDAPLLLSYDMAKKEAEKRYEKAFKNLLDTDYFSFEKKLESTNQVFIGRMPSLSDILFIGKTNSDFHELKKEFDFLRRMHEAIDVLDTSLIPFPFYFGKVKDYYFLIEKFLNGELLADYLNYYSYSSTRVIAESLKNLMLIDETLSSNYYLFGRSVVPEFDYAGELAKRLERSPSFVSKKSIILDATSPILEEITQFETQICHGDPHSRNFVVAYDGVKVLDFEKLCWANPFYDISYFLEQPDISPLIKDKEGFIQNLFNYKAIDVANYSLMASYIDLFQAVRSSGWYHRRGDKYFLELENFFRNRALFHLNKIKDNFSSHKKKKLEELIAFLEEDNYLDTKEYK